MAEHPLGRLVPTDWTHVERFHFSAVAPAVQARVGKSLPLPGSPRTLQRVLDEQGEASVVVDRVNGRSCPRRIARPN